MKKVFAALVILMTANAAMADINTVCQGGRTSGKEFTIEIAHVLSTPGSVSEKAIFNGASVRSVFQRETETGFEFSLETRTRVYTFEYNEMEATGKLIGQGLDIDLFCSRIH